MSTNNFEGHLAAKSFLNGVDLGKDLKLSNVTFNTRSFRADDGPNKVDVDYGGPLAAGSHVIVVGSGTSGHFIYLGNQTLGTITVNVGALLDQQSATFDVKYVDIIGREIEVKGDYEGKLL